MCVEINNANFVLQEDLDFKEWSRLMDSVAMVEDCRRMPIYFYRLLDGSVKSVTDALGRLLCTPRRTHFLQSVRSPRATLCRL
jgi:hypothetical protein